MTSAISVFGNLTIDDLVFADGSTRWAVPGGSAAYAAMGASLWTESASIVAPIGTDYPVEALGKRIDLSRCRRVPRTLRNWGLYEDDGRRHFVSRSARVTGTNSALTLLTRGPAARQRRISPQCRMASPSN